MCIECGESVKSTTRLSNNTLRCDGRSVLFAYNMCTSINHAFAHAERAKILNSDREVVGLHKQRYVFPLIIHVIKASGAAADSIFLGTIKVCFGA